LAECRRDVERRPVKEESKRFFFEKKKQKTFGPAGVGDSVARARRSKVFFASFLFTKKKTLLYKLRLKIAPDISSPVVLRYHNESVNWFTAA
jgi:hypothetical protein